jgi:IMP dehydrogenase
MTKLKYEFPLGLSYDDVLLVPQYSKINSRSEVNLSVKLSPRIKLRLPIIATCMTDVTGVEMAIAIAKLGGFAYLPRFNHYKEQANMVKKVKQAKVLVGAAVGLRNDFLKRANTLVKAGCDVILIDVAQGHMQKAITATKKLNQLFGKNVDIHSGLVATADGVERLFDAGADCVHVGIGGGSICTTRIAAGCGVPNITTILNTAPIAKKYKKAIVIDAGAKNSGDIVKALAAGASAVRTGNLLAGTDEAPGMLKTINGNKFKVYNASTSATEKKYHLKKGVVFDKNYINHIEGVESFVPYKGSLKNHLALITAGVKSGFSYCGAKNINELQRKAKFIRITPGGFTESNAHDVILIHK